MPNIFVKYRFLLMTFLFFVMLIGVFSYVTHSTVDAHSKTDVVRGVFTYKPGRANVTARSFIGKTEVYCSRPVLGSGGDCAGMQELQDVEVEATVAISHGFFGGSKYVLSIRSESKRQSFYWSQPVSNLQTDDVLNSILGIIFPSLILTGFATILFQKTLLREAN
jgi:hypothetical protein